MIISGLDIICKSSDLELSLSDWVNLQIEDHISTTLKNHFTNAHLNLKQVMGPTIQNIPFHQDNHMTEKLLSLLNYSLFLPSLFTIGRWCSVTVSETRVVLGYIPYLIRFYITLSECPTLGP